MRNTLLTALLISVALYDPSSQGVNAVQLELEAAAKMELEDRTQFMLAEGPNDPLQLAELDSGCCNCESRVRFCWINCCK